MIRKKIELHRKVFPNHAVVGWYRVVRGDDNYATALPTEDDLRMTRTEIWRYCVVDGMDDDDDDAGGGGGGGSSTMGTARSSSSWTSQEERGTMAVASVVRHRLGR